MSCLILNKKNRVAKIKLNLDLLEDFSILFSQKYLLFKFRIKINRNLLKYSKGFSF